MKKKRVMILKSGKRNRVFEVCPRCKQPVKALLVVFDGADKPGLVVCGSCVQEGIAALLTRWSEEQAGAVGKR